MDDNAEQETTKLIDDCMHRIREHVDTVQIFITLHGDDGKETLTYDVGSGNFYARQGQVEEWVRIQRVYQKQYAKSKSE